MAAESVVLAGAVRLLQKPLNDLWDAGKDKFKVSLNRWRNENLIQELVRHTRQVARVKTLWSTDKEVLISSFYYPPKVQFDSHVSKHVDTLADLGVGQNYVIQGTVGQGKSIYLRHLCVQELRQNGSGRVPVFAEFRRIEKGATLKEFIYQAMRRLGFLVDDDLFSFYAKSGKIVLLLDAFDEIDPEIRDQAITYLDNLSAEFPKLQIIVTSRPNSGIQGLASFRVIRLCPLGETDHLPFLKKINDDQKQAVIIHKAIKNSATQIKTLLTTPLLLTLLVMVYRAHQAILATVPDFYQQLFDVLFYRHDRQKPGYTRRRHTNLSEKKIKDLFEALCFYTRRAQVGVLTKDDFHKRLEEAQSATGIVVNEDHYKDEIVKVACLMQEEGFELSFIHKSVQEFHAASFVAKSGEETGRRFYAKIGAKWHQWEQELAFLSQIDSYRYAKYFLMPAIDSALSQIGITVESKLDDSEIDVAIAALNNLVTILSVRESKTARFYGFRYTGANSFTMQEILSEAMYEIVVPLRINGDKEVNAALDKVAAEALTAQSDADKETVEGADGKQLERFEISLNKLFSEGALKGIVRKAIRQAIANRFAQYQLALEELRRERARQESMDVI